MRVREGAKKGLRAGWGWGGIGEKGGEAGVKQERREGRRA